MKKVFAGENCGREAAVYLGRAGKNRYFGWTGPLQKNCPTALLGRAAFAAYERFAGGKTSAEGWLCHPEHLNHRRAERALGPRSPKRKTRYKRVFLFGGGGESRTPVVEAGRVELPSENPSMGTSPGADGYCGSLALPVPVTLGKPSRPGVW